MLMEFYAPDTMHDECCGKLRIDFALKKACKTFAEAMARNCEVAAGGKCCFAQRVRYIAYEINRKDCDNWLRITRIFTN